MNAVALMTQALLVLACLVIVAAAVLGVFHPDFDDTAVQRAGLSLAASGALIILYQTVTGASADRATTLAITGAAVFAAGTVLKLRGRVGADR